jgi:hypothetical protein
MILGIAPDGSHAPRNQGLCRPRWNLTLPVAEAFQERLAQKGWLVRSVKPDRTSFWVCQAPADPPPDPKEIAVSSAIDGIIDDLQKFAPSVSNYYNPDRSRDDLKDILIRFLVSLDGYSATAMAKNLRELDAEDAADPADSPLQGLEDGGEPLTEQDRYLCARFVKHLAQTNSPQLKHLTSLVAVGLLTEVVADFVKPTGVVKKSDLTVVLDAPLALDLLGTSAPRFSRMQRTYSSRSLASAASSSSSRRAAMRWRAHLLLCCAFNRTSDTA